MKRVCNFYSGPATLPAEVLQEVQSSIYNYRNLGLSLIETSHRSDEYQEVHQKAISRIRNLLKITESYEVLFLGGGATLQFSMLPMNFMTVSGIADYVDSGAWAQKAIADAQQYGTARVIWKDPEQRSLPASESIESESDYLHITSNETINGVQWKTFPRCSAPLAADMSSDILSRPMDVEQFGIIYAGAQKNLGPAGVTIVIIRKDLLERCPSSLGAYLNYRTHAKAKSLYNTPPVFSIWVMSLVLAWIERSGGLAAMEKMNNEKADMIYSVMSNSDGFYRCPVDPLFRSTMNVVFTLRNTAHEPEFFSGAAERNLIGLKGHRSVGGMRASMYNAMPVEGAQALAEYMREFAKKRA